jgi:hypothetical protein
MSMPPGQPLRRPGHQHRPPPLPPTPQPGRRAWPRRHPNWFTVIAIIGLLIISTACAPPSTTASHNAADSPTATSAVATAVLPCQAQPSSKRPRDHTTVKIRVHTAAHARVKATGPLALVNGESAAGRASAHGTRTVRFRVGDATPGIRIVITVHVTRIGRTGTCRASLRPRPAPAIAAPAQPAPQPSSAPAQPASCHPLSDEGTCYEPGEFCRESDEGVTGVAGDGQTITCENNDGLRWEPT